MSRSTCVATTNGKSRARGRARKISIISPFALALALTLAFTLLETKKEEKNHVCSSSQANILKHLHNMNEAESYSLTWNQILLSAMTFSSLLLFS